MRRGRRGHGREEGCGQCGAEAERGDERDGQLRDVAQQRQRQDGDDPERAHDRHEGTEGGEPVRRAPEEHVAPDHRRGQAGGQADAPDPAVAALPEAHGGDPDQCAERRGQGDRVVGVDDALGQADDESDAHQGAAPQQESGPLAVGAAGPQGDDEEDGTHHQRAGEQPRHHVAERRVEEPGEAGRAPHAPGDPAAADAARLVAREPAEAVVAEDQVEDAVVLRPADVGAVGGGGQRDDRPPTSPRPPRRRRPSGTTCQTRRHHPVGAASR